MKDKIYISGPISGTKDYMERFEKAEQELIDLGFTVINPAQVNAQLPSNTMYSEYMEMSITMLSFCDSIYMLKGWEKSNGAKLELQYAKTMGYFVMYEDKEVIE